MNRGMVSAVGWVDINLQPKLPFNAIEQYRLLPVEEKRYHNLFFSGLKSRRRYIEVEFQNIDGTG